MAKFKCEFSNFTLPDGRHGSSGGNFSGLAGFAELSSEDLLEVLRPAAERLKDAYVSTINRLFKRRTGSLADSIKTSELGLDREYMDTSEASISVGPSGRHSNGKRGARSRAGPSTRKYAKHNRDAKATALSNAELGYLLEFGTPRIAATHWLENTNEAVEDEIQSIIDAEYTKLLQKKGLIQ